MFPDHPAIREAERYGEPDELFPICPVCGEEADTFYKTDYGNIVGCDNCITKVDAWDEIDEI